MKILSDREQRWVIAHAAHDRGQVQRFRRNGERPLILQIIKNSDFHVYKRVLKPKMMKKGEWA
ncbi:hypothetical protein DT065_03980 [Salicibibacter kimchii]|uniref:Uncharacterized protein n=1 Tax=Salicibibacter kimchii TaxID=2099786 RepID=A0A345BWC9_9BACI|nr:hypothetical protein DT065_03980 [Salicibibacter kimchii]